jgi:hypothetical protein
MKRFFPLCVTIAVAAVGLAVPRAQTPAPQPPPPAQAPQTPPATDAAAHPDFSGTWTIDRNYSNDPAQAKFDGQSTNQGSTQRRAGGSGFGGGLGGFGRGGSFGGGSRSRGGNSNSTGDGSTTPDEKARLAAITDEIKKAMTTLTISHHEPSFVVTDGLEHAFFSHTTGERESQTLGDVSIPGETRWDGDHIVTEFDVSSRRRLIFTYALLPATKQMVLRIRLDVSSGQTSSQGSSQGSGQQELKLVYKLKPEAA